MKKKHTELGDGGEFDRIRAIWKRLGKSAAPLGDDCAIIDSGGVSLALSADLSIEGTHFERGWIGLDEIGWRAAMASLSDLAAVAADPIGVFVSIGISAEVPEDWPAEIMSGVAAAADSVGGKVLGGDIVRSDRLIIDTVVLGSLPVAPVLRSGARIGDRLFVSGELGGPVAAVTTWNDRREPDHTARERFARPHARVREAHWLRDRGATAMIDLSDGLFADAGHLGAASKAACVLDVGALPVHPACSGTEAALFAGEEYELLVAMPKKSTVNLTAEFAETFGLPLTAVGEMEAGVGVALKHVAGLELDIRTFQHF